MKALQSYGPVRKIGVKSRGVVGTMPSVGEYESTLERDLMEVLRFDPKVEALYPQPLTITYTGTDGRALSYTPDGLIVFKPTMTHFVEPVLYEVKYRADFRKDWKKLIPKFRAAKHYSQGRGWRFQVFTEREIRTPYLSNVRFLWQFRERPCSEEMRGHILRTLRDLEEADPDLLVYALCTSAASRAEMIPKIWHLVSTGHIGCDLDVPLTMRSPLWVCEVAE